MTDQPVFVLGSDLQALEPAAFETEEEFQELLALHPRVLDFGSLADGQPLRLVLVAREMGVPTSAESGSDYWLDHLFVDADGMPTLVEVKRASETRIRREAVGQMLDYVANGARHWPGALLQRSFEETCLADGRSLEEAYGELLGDRSAEEFWSMVEERLAAGQMRLLFVADRIPGRSSAADAADGRVRGRVDPVPRRRRPSRPGPAHPRGGRHSGEVAFRPPRNAEDHARRHGHGDTDSPRPGTEADRDRAPGSRGGQGTVGGRYGQVPKMSVVYPVAGRQVPIWTLSLYDNPAKEELAFSFGSITHHLGLDGAVAFAESLPTVPELARKLEVQREKGYKGWPSVPLTALAAEPEAVEGILGAIQRLMDGVDASV